MTTLYRPVLIETAEQAEALPVGTVARDDGWTAMKLQDGRWIRLWPSGGRNIIDPTGLTALVPIEAGTEYRPDTTAIRPWGETTPHPLPEQARYVTEWEDA